MHAWLLLIELIIASISPLGGHLPPPPGSSFPFFCFLFAGAVGVADQSWLSSLLASLQPFLGLATYVHDSLLVSRRCWLRHLFQIHTIPFLSRFAGPFSSLFLLGHRSSSHLVPLCSERTASYRTWYSWFCLAARYSRQAGGRGSCGFLADSECLRFGLTALGSSHMVFWCGHFDLGSACFSDAKCFKG